MIAKRDRRAAAFTRRRRSREFSRVRDASAARRLLSPAACVQAQQLVSAQQRRLKAVCTPTPPRFSNCERGHANHAAGAHDLHGRGHYFVGEVARSVTCGVQAQVLRRRRTHPHGLPFRGNVRCPSPRLAVATPPLSSPMSPSQAPRGPRLPPSLRSRPDRQKSSSPQGRPIGSPARHRIQRSRHRNRACSWNPCRPRIVPRPNLGL